MEMNENYNWAPNDPGKKSKMPLKVGPTRLAIVVIKSVNTEPLTICR